MTHSASLVRREFISKKGYRREKVWGACSCGWEGLPYMGHRAYLAERDIKKHLS